MKWCIQVLHPKTLPSFLLLCNTVSSFLPLSKFRNKLFPVYHYTNASLYLSLPNFHCLIQTPINIQSYFQAKTCPSLGDLNFAIIDAYFPYLSLHDSSTSLFILYQSHLMYMLLSHPECLLED